MILEDRSEAVGLLSDSDQLDIVDPRIAAAEALLVYYPRFNICLKRIEKCFRLYGVTAEPPCLAIVGESGMGKTTIMNKFASLHPRKTHKEGAEIPVLVASVPSKPTVKALVETLLYELGDPLYMRGSAEEKTTRLIHLIKQCRVRLILLDEFQHFVDRANENVAHEVADWLKRTIDKARVAVVVFGLERCTGVFKANEQLRGRFSAHILLKPFDWWDPADRTLFRAFLRAVEKQLPMPVTPRLSSLDLAYRFHYASAGHIRPVMKIVRGAVHEAVETGQKQLDIDLFAKVFASEVWNDSDCKINPFTEAFDTNPKRATQLPEETRETTSRIKKANKRAVSEILKT